MGVAAQAPGSGRSGHMPDTIESYMARLVVSLLWLFLLWLLLLLFFSKQIPYRTVI